MFLYFANWSNRKDLIRRMQRADLVHTNQLFKVYTSTLDPRELIDKNISVREISGEPFGNWDQFPIEGRRGYTGDELESALLRRDLHGLPAQVTRALTRFAFSDEMQVVQFAMSIPKDSDVWVFNHPFEILHGLKQSRQKEKKAAAIHLDIYSPRSIERLGRLIDLENPSTLLSVRETAIVISKVSSIEGSIKPGRERL